MLWFFIFFRHSRFFAQRKELHFSKLKALTIFQRQRRNQVFCRGNKTVLARIKKAIYGCLQEFMQIGQLLPAGVKPLIRHRNISHFPSA
ncbi:hypothetical protein D3C84_784290 [compost metagenome]